jgi:hypothetical protein
MQRYRLRSERRMNFYLGPEIYDCLRGRHSTSHNADEGSDRMMAEDKTCPEAAIEEERSPSRLPALIAYFIKRS